MFVFLLFYCFCFFTCSFKPRKTRTQLGPREAAASSTKKPSASSQKKSTRRAEAVFPTRVKPLAHMPLPLPSQKPVQTEDQRAVILKWVRFHSETHLSFGYFIFSDYRLIQPLSDIHISARLSALRLRRKDSMPAKMRQWYAFYSLSSIL